MSAPTPIEALEARLRELRLTAFRAGTASAKETYYHALSSAFQSGELVPADALASQAATIRQMREALERASVTVKRYRRAGFGDDVFHSDLCEADRAIDAALNGGANHG